MAGKHELLGQTFGQLKVVERMPSTRAGRMWRCICTCGKEATIPSGNLLSGNTTSCGCTWRSKVGDKLRTHGHCSGPVKTAEYKIWVEMIRRCTKEDHPAYYRYGRRGISVSDSWRYGEGQLGGFECFIRDMGLRPSKLHSLDRHPNNETGNYELGNCRWALSKDQNRNRRDNVWVEWNGQNILLCELCDQLGLKFAPIRIRLRKGMSLQDAINKPLRGQAL